MSDKQEINVAVVSDGTVDGTHVIDADTGRRLVFTGAQYAWHVLYDRASKAGIAQVALVLQGAPVIVPQPDADSFELVTALPKRTGERNGNDFNG